MANLNRYYYKQNIPMIGGGLGDFLKKHKKAIVGSLGSAAIAALGLAALHNKRQHDSFNQWQLSRTPALDQDWASRMRGWGNKRVTRPKKRKLRKN